MQYFIVVIFVLFLFVALTYFLFYGHNTFYNIHLLWIQIYKYIAYGDIMAYINFASWNVKGLGRPTKLNKVLAHLNTLHVQIAFLQETHLSVSEQMKLRRSWVSQSFHSLFNSRARGVAIIIHKNVMFTASDVIADRGGRYVIVTGTLFNTPVILANVYAPNYDDEGFFVKFLSSIPNLDSHQLIVGGDLNTCLDSSLDRSSKRQITTSRSAKVINSFLTDYAVVDVWRSLNPTSRAYSFFSNVHQTFSRIDYFLLDKKLIPSVKACTYEAIVISDHSPLSLKLKFDDIPMTHPRWRFDTSMLSDEYMTRVIAASLDFYIHTNSTPDVSHCTIWEALKAFMRGRLISISSFQKKQHSQEITRLTQQIRQIDDQLASDPSPELIKDRLLVKAEFDTLTTKDIEKMILRSRHSYYESGEKAHRLLAHQLRQSSASNIISEIKTPNGLTHDFSEINNAFREHYISLYTSEQNCTPVEMEQFFTDITIPQVDEATVDSLDSPISLEEVKAAISALQTNKSPGPDGFTVEFYKAFSAQLIPLLLDMYNESFELGHLPQTLCEASIILLLKKNKDPLLCGSYRPVSLLPVDFKILAKVLATRLESILPHIISPDQTGFVKNRFSFFNIRRLFNIIYHPSQATTSEVIISLDAETAFDRISWRYLFYTLERFGFGKNFISWVKLLYAAPMSSVRTNNVSSEPFSVSRGTRQGCPLSPLLFAVAIEPLALFLRQTTQLTGIFREGQEHRVSLYADDLLLYLSDYSHSLPAALNILERFGKLSGYKINLSKSELFPVNNVACSMSFNTSPFKVTSKFTYLGINVPDKFSKLFKENFPPLVAKVEQLLKRWTQLPLSVAGRINSIKMSILPKFTYLFQNIPVFIPKSFFRKLDSILSSFIWNHKTARARKSLLTQPKRLGGMSLPDFQLYYWACNIRPMLHWLYEDPGADALSWQYIESQSCKPSSLAALVYSPLSSKTNHTTNLLVKTSMKIWTQIRRHFGWHSISFRAPVYANHCFKPSVIDKAFLIWHNAGIKQFENLYHNSTFVSFQYLHDTYNIPKNHFFRFLQIRNYIRNISPTFPSQPPCAPYDHVLLRPLSFKGIISACYGRLMALSSSNTSELKSQWEGELGESISEETWEAALDRVHSSSICARHGFLQFKVLHRSHWTKLRMSKRFPDVDPLCDRCKCAPASHTHMFWSCHKLAKYWSSIFDIISGFLDQPVSPCPVIGIFGVVPDHLGLTNAQSHSIAFLTLLARRLILMKWKDCKPPTVTHWVKEVLYFLKLEKVRHSLKDLAKGPTTDTYRKIWGPFLDYIKTHTTLSI